jgi:hypothetical protein
MAVKRSLYAAADSHAPVSGNIRRSKNKIRCKRTRLSGKTKSIIISIFGESNVSFIGVSFTSPKKCEGVKTFA